MTTYSWPTAFAPSACTLHLEPNLREFVSPWTGGYDVIDLMGERWRMTVALPPRKRINSGAVEAFFNRLRGLHTVSAWHFARPYPTGTMRGSPLLSAGVAQGASTLLLKSAGASATLKAGDMLGLGGQWLQVAADATADGSGNMTVYTVNRVRTAASTDAAVAWDKPLGTFRLASPRVAVTHLPVIAEGLELELIETW